MPAGRRGSDRLNHAEVDLYVSELDTSGQIKKSNVSKIAKYTDCVNYMNPKYYITLK